MHCIKRIHDLYTSSCLTHRNFYFFVFFIVLQINYPVQPFHYLWTIRQICHINLKTKIFDDDGADCTQVLNTRITEQEHAP